MEFKQMLKTKQSSYFIDRFFKKLNEPQSIVQPLTSLCGGWYLETFKQVINKLSKNKSSPLPFFFPNVDTMQPISKNKPLLRTVFKTFDTRGFNRIDASELYASCLALSKGSYETYLKTIVDIFGFENSGKINRNEFFFFLDTFHRALPKILIVKGQKNSEINVRLDFKDINKYLDVLFDQDKIQIERNQIYEAMMKLPQLNEFMKYIQKRCNSSAQSSRNTAIERIKMETEVRKTIADMIVQVQKRIEVK